MATNLKNAIDSSGKSLNQISKDTGIPMSTLFRRYQGKNPWDTEQIEAVAHAIDEDPDRLILVIDQAQAS